MPTDKEKFWEKIRYFQFDEPGDSYKFADRLASENRWKHSFAVGAVEEYKKFIFLLCFSKNPLTPSDEVEQVWRMHLLYTKNYWTLWCKETLEKEIHYSPPKGGGRTTAQYFEFYKETLESYKEFFAQNPPAKFWPEPDIRFSFAQFSRVDLYKYWLLPKII